MSVEAIARTIVKKLTDKRKKLIEDGVALVISNSV